MAREYCEMMQKVNDRLCCDCYDYGCMECKNVKKCPMGYDNDEDFSDDEYDDECEFSEDDE